MSYNNISTFLRHPDYEISDSVTERESGRDQEKYKSMGLGTLRFRVIML